MLAGWEGTVLYTREGPIFPDNHDEVGTTTQQTAMLLNASRPAEPEPEAGRQPDGLDKLMRMHGKEPYWRREKKMPWW